MVASSRSHDRDSVLYLVDALRIAARVFEYHDI